MPKSAKKGGIAVLCKFCQADPISNNAFKCGTLTRDDEPRTITCWRSYAKRLIREREIKWTLHDEMEFVKYIGCWKYYNPEKALQKQTTTERLWHLRNYLKTVKLRANPEKFFNQVIKNVQDEIKKLEKKV